MASDNLTGFENTVIVLLTIITGLLAMIWWNHR